MFSLAVLVKRSVASIPLSPPQPLYTLTPVFSGENSYVPSANLLPSVAESQQEKYTSLASLGFGNGHSMLAQSCPESYTLSNSHSPGPKAPRGSLRLSMELEQFLLPAASRVCGKLTHRKPHWHLDRYGTGNSQGDHPERMSEKLLADKDRSQLHNTVPVLRGKPAPTIGP